MTNLSNTIFYLSILIWLLPPFRQYKTFFFSYFLVLGIADVLVFFTTKFFEMSSYDFYVIVSFSLFIALQEIEYLKKKKIMFIGLGLIVICLSFFRIGNNPYISFIAVLHLMIILRILYLFVMVVAQKHAINFFYLVLAFYEFTILLKFLNFLFELKVEAETYFYITTFFELIVGIFFTTFREDSSKLVYKLK
ncbi:MAG: hypothetical protein Q8N83_01680 [Ignavibacteria bacterium]|nr:hypothetical protein [Ignavibacteria bacterium]